MALGTTIPITKALGDLICNARMAKKWTQGDLADKSGVSTFSVGRWERADGKYVRAGEFCKILKPLGLSEQQVEEAATGKSVALVVVDDSPRRGRPKGSKNNAPVVKIGRPPVHTYSVLHEVVIKVVSTVTAKSPRAAGLEAKRVLIDRLVADSEDELVVGFDVKRIQISDGDDGAILLGT